MVVLVLPHVTPIALPLTVALPWLMPGILCIFKAVALLVLPVAVACSSCKGPLLLLPVLPVIGVVVTSPRHLSLHGAAPLQQSAHMAVSTGRNRNCMGPRV